MVENYGDIVHQQYVAMYKTGTRGREYFKYISLGYPRWLIPPPVIDMIEQDYFKRDGKNMVVRYVMANTQAEIAQAFGIKQQQVSRYMKNPNPFKPKSTEKTK